MSTSTPRQISAEYFFKPKLRGSKWTAVNSVQTGFYTNDPSLNLNFKNTTGLVESRSFPKDRWYPYFSIEVGGSNSRFLWKGVGSGTGGTT